jgi:hypothetical protein
VSRGCETRELALPRDGQGRLGFEVDAEGFITHVERFTFAETTGLRPGARLLRVCGQTLPRLGPEAAAQLLRSAPKVCVTVLPPDESGRPRRSGRPGRREVGELGSWPAVVSPSACSHRSHVNAFVLEKIPGLVLSLNCTLPTEWN